MEDKKLTKIERFNVYSDEVEEVLSRPPRWLFLTGNSIVGLVVLSLLLLSWVVKYPDVIATTALISSEVAPIKIVSRSEGLLSELRVKDGDRVEKDSVLAIITSEIDYEDFKIFEDFISNVEAYMFKGKRKVKFPEDLQIGELTLDYAEMKSLFQNYVSLSQSHPYYKEASKIRSQIRATSDMIEELENSKIEAQEQITIADKNLQRQRKLYEEDIISAIDLENTEYEFINNKSRINNVNIRVKELYTSIESLNRQYEALNKNEQRSIAEIKSRINAVVNRIKARIDIWKSKHLVLSPASGICTHMSFLQTNQPVNPKDDLFIISPDNEKFSVRGRLPIVKSGQVKVGQKVILKLLSFPFKEHGVLTANVSKISLIPDGEGYMFFAELENGLVTNYDKELPFKPMMQAQSEIVREDLRLIERIFYEIKNLFAAK